MSLCLRKFDKFCFIEKSLLILFFALSSCDTFEPINQDEAAFSIIGYLDASADTQWVRVTPLREQINQPEYKPKMTVTLENLDTGESVIMRDSLFLNPNGFHYLNVWTTMEIDPGSSYRLKAKRPNGAVSQVTVTLPVDFPTPLLISAGPSFSVGQLLIKGVDRLADVQVLWPRGRVPYGNTSRNTAPEGYEYLFILTLAREVWYFYERVGRTSPPLDSFIDVPRQVFVASGGPEWIDDFASMEDIVYNLPQTFSNIEGGVGYLVGIVSKTIPFKSCFDDDGEHIACPLETPMF